MNWITAGAALPLGLFGLLNIFLAFVAPGQARGAGGAAFVFGVSAAAILLGLWRGQPLLVTLGCVLAMISPVWMGMLMSSNVNPLHIAVRFLVVAVCFGLWLRFRPV